MRMSKGKARKVVRILMPTATEVGFGPEGYMVWHVFDRATNETLGIGLSEKGAWLRALDKIDRIRTPQADKEDQ